MKEHKKLKEHQKIPEKRWIFKMEDKFRSQVQKKGEYVEGFGYSHGPSAAIWRTMLEKSYVKRMNIALDLFDIPKYKNTTEYSETVVADVGCGPWGGISFVRRWPAMYLIDPSWSVYEKEGVVKILSNKGSFFIEDYAQTFTLPEKANIIFSINTLNHGGDAKSSLDNIMKNLKDDGLFFLHLHMREKEEADNGHPMPLYKENLQELFNEYNIIQCNWLDGDPLKSMNGHKTVVATLRNKKEI